jgi:hypothetical protein
MMLIAAFVTLTLAVLLGATLGVLYLRGPAAASAPWPMAALHALLGIAGLVCLLFSLGGPPRGVEFGVGSFGAISAVLLVLAALAGLGVLLLYRLKRRRVGTLIGLHATLAISGFVILAAYLLV